MEETKMLRAADAFQKVVLEKRSLRDVAPELGISRETVRRDVAAFRGFLASERGAEAVEERRAVFMAEVQATQARALHLYERYKDAKPLAAVAALNSYIATLAHVRAVEGLDTPKEVKAEVDQRLRIVWDEGDDTEPVYTR